MEAKFWKLKNKRGMSIKILNYGATLTSISIPDKAGKFDDVAFGFDKLEDYIKFNDYFGSTTGRYAGRICKGVLKIDGKKYQLTTNNNGNHLHGGLKGLDKVFWDGEEIKTEKGSAIKLTYLSPDGENSYPGTVSFTVIYTLTEKNEIYIEMFAVTDKKTVINLTNHTYFNLKGVGDTTILDHYAKFNADFYIPLDETAIPTGEILSVKNSPMDFRKFKTIGQDIEKDNPTLKNGKGYDLPYITPITNDSEINSIAKIYEERTGRELEIFSNQPAFVFYTGNWLKGTFKAKDKKTYLARSGFCIEPGGYPDSVNQLHFPQNILTPDKIYKNVIVYKFSVKK